MSRRKQLRPFKVQDEDDSNTDPSKGASNGRSASPTDDHTPNQACDDSAEEMDGTLDERGSSDDAHEREKRLEIFNSESIDGKKSAANQQERKKGSNNVETISGRQTGDGDKNENNSTEHLSLEALEDTKNAVAQFAAAALAKGPNETSIKDLTMLQSALFTLQHQQVFQMQLIEQLQFQLAKTNPRRDKQLLKSQSKSAKGDEDQVVEETADGAQEDFVHNSAECGEPNDEKLCEITESVEKSKGHESNADEKSTETDSPDYKISSTLASNIITNHDFTSATGETNSLQLLQQRAEEVLDSASQSFTTGNLIDELSYRTGAFFNDGPTDDPSMKHRCRFCGKIFGSDSALQIHLRSHTGERPFVCRVCKSRFTTKGNLKVHYQRHTETDYMDEAKKNLPPPYDFRMQSKPPKSKPISDKVSRKDTLPRKREEPEDAYYNNELNEAARASVSPKTDETSRSHLNFDQEYSSSKKKAWEKFMEIVDTPKATELQQDEAYRVDPNKCPICNRLLSCRSALRQHYRTHTGERPFRCRLCARSFTTKGNLKTHVSVHKINPLLSPVHSCTVCHKKYSTGHALQQHINTHTGAPTDMTIDQIRASEVRDFVSHDSFSEIYGSNSSLGDYNESTAHESSLDFDSEHKSFDESPSKRKKMDDLSDSEDSRGQSLRIPHDFEKEIEKVRKDFGYANAKESKAKRKSTEADKKSESNSSMDFFPKFPPIFGSPSVPVSPPSTMMSGSLNSLLGANSFNSVGFAAGVRGNTTCNICFKTLACQSALEIHYRSHTKEKPYVCQLCNRGFSTKGNMKQHMLTHKIRDMPQHVFRNSTQSPSSDSNNSLSATGFQAQQPPEPAETALNPDDTLNADRQLKASAEQDKNAAVVTSLDQSNPTYLSSDDSGSMSSPLRARNGANGLIEFGADDDEIKSNSFPNASNAARHKSKTPTKADSGDESIETPRTTKAKTSKSDYCKMCSKHFGSHSALEAHMRSHTGAKPFGCPICEKSFSTKGNLKVHMGTHSWTGDTKRTNHARPLDLPNHFSQMHPYNMHRPVDLFNPFIANAAALQQKLHEANLYQKYMSAANLREFSADTLKTNDQHSLHRNLFGLAHLPFQMFNDHINLGSMKNK